MTDTKEDEGLPPDLAQQNARWREETLQTRKDRLALDHQIETRAKREAAMGFALTIDRSQRDRATAQEVVADAAVILKFLEGDE